MLLLARSLVFAHCCVICCCLPIAQSHMLLFAHCSESYVTVGPLLNVSCYYLPTALCQYVTVGPLLLSVHFDTLCPLAGRGHPWCCLRCCCLWTPCSGICTCNHWSWTEQCWIFTSTAYTVMATRWKKIRRSKFLDASVTDSCVCSLSNTRTLGVVSLYTDSTWVLCLMTAGI